MIPKPCIQCDKRDTCRAQCKLIYDLTCDESQREWKRLEDKLNHGRVDPEKLSEEDILVALNDVSDMVIFDKPLSNRESEVVTLLMTGFSRQEIAEDIGISMLYLRKIIQRIRSKTSKKLSRNRY
jgi:ATP/maltotriose-dependent transcriptional regulator MalT